jgi:hypothetical protein
MSETVQCPACSKTIAVKGIPKHTNGCPKWAEVIGVPPSQFNFDRHFKRKRYAEGAAEGEDYVRCLLCPDHRAKRLADHLKVVHGLTVSTYLEQFPGALTYAQRILKQRSATAQAKYGVSNVAQADEVKVLLRKNNRAQVPEAVAKRKATNKARYGHENPFAADVVQRRIRVTNLKRFGVPNPNQSPVVMAKRMATNRLKYGVDHFFQTKGFLDKYLTNAPNKLELRVAEMLPERVVYAGDGVYWVKAKGALRARNPDFIVLSDGQLRARKNGVELNELRTSAVVEVLGSYWHGPKFTGQTRTQHKREIVDYYWACGIRCLAIWEDEVHKHPQRVTDRIQRFIRRWEIERAARIRSQS